MYSIKCRLGLLFPVVFATSLPFAPHCGNSSTSIMEYHFPAREPVMEYHWPSSSSLKRARSPEEGGEAEGGGEEGGEKEKAEEEEAESPAYSDSHACTRESVIQQIEAIFAALAAASSPAAPLQLLLTPRRSSSFDPSTSTIRRPLSTAPTTVVSFPKDAWRFACLLKILDLLHESLVSGHRATTKRDLFYKHPTLFRTQRVVDGFVDDLAATLCVPRAALGVVASAKGLLHGDVVIGGRHFLADGGGVLVPGELHDVVLGEQLAWVLVVEKEAVFRALACADGKRGVVVTGKGYPDVATREVVRLLAAARRSSDGARLRMFVLVDLDPHGVDIAATYRFGSVAMAWENHRLAVHRLEWVGVRSSDLAEAVARSSGDGQVEGTARLTARDRRKAAAMLARPWIHAVPEWRSELQNMLFLGVKAEIEIVSGVGVKRWVEERIAASMGGVSAIAIAIAI